MKNRDRIVITGVGLAAPNAVNLAEFRKNLLAGVSGITMENIKHIGPVPTGFVKADVAKYLTKQQLQDYTRVAQLGIYCAEECFADAGVNVKNNFDSSRLGIYVGTTEHGTVQVMQAMEELLINGADDDYPDGFDPDYWSAEINPNTVANHPAGMISVHFQLHGPAYTVGAACAGGNLGIKEAYDQLVLGYVDAAIGGGLSETPRAFGAALSFKLSNALGMHEDATKASRPFDVKRNGVIVSEGGAFFYMERLDDAKKRGAKIYAEVLGCAVNSDGSGSQVNPDKKSQKDCMLEALRLTGLKPSDVDIICSHATSTPTGDPVEVAAINEIFSGEKGVFVNGSKSHIGHTMGASGALEAAGNLGSFTDDLIHPTINVDDLDPLCKTNLVMNKAIDKKNIKIILNNNFGMLGINSTLVLKKCLE